MNRRPLLGAGITLAASVTFGLTARAETMNTIRSRGELVVAIDLVSSPFGQAEIMATGIRKRYSGVALLEQRPA